MKRSPPPARRAPLPRSKTRIKSRYRTRGGRNSDLAKGRWIKTLPCWAGGLACRGPVEKHHVRIGGARATDKLMIPLCIPHHRPPYIGSIEVMGRKAFEAIHGSTLEAAEQYERVWQLRKQTGLGRQAGSPA